MTEILERDDCDGLEPDQWAGIHRHYSPSRQQELDQLTREFFLAGGVATWVPPKREVERTHGHYYYPAGESKPRAQSQKRMDAQKARDLPKVEIILLWLNDGNEPVSRRSMAKEIGMSEWKLADLLNTYLSDDARVAHVLHLGEAGRQEQAEELDRATKELILMHVDMGVRGITALSRSTGLSQNQIARIADKYELNIRRSPRHETV